MKFAVGSLVSARGREWVVLPESKDHRDLLILRPLIGTEDEVTGIYLPLEKVEPAQFSPPDPSGDLGNHRSCSLLRDAVRLGFRSGAGPFRSLAGIAVDPRPYQLVPLLVALRLDPVRLLISDDVGIGKTVEALLIARELLDRGEIRRIAVLCPPHLAEQWQRAMVGQFHIDVVAVLPGTAGRLEREAGLSPHQSLFEHYPHVVISLDFIKSDRRRHEFLRTCAEFVIVDEAHTCTLGLGRGSQQRHELLKGLAKDPTRHIVLVTATPHSGKEESFRSLLTLIVPDFHALPTDLSGEENRSHRERIAEHFIQRRRGDLKEYLDSKTPFPERDIAEEHYPLAKEYRRFFDRVLAYCREWVVDPKLDKRRQRVRWWSALALLRSIASSPMAAAATLRTRASSADTDTPEEADEVGRRTVLDLDDETTEGTDVPPGSECEEPEAMDERARLLRLAREVEELAGTKDSKLKYAGDMVEKLLKDGFSPILFCRFIPTVEYIAAALRQRLGRQVEVAGITGLLPPEERERRVSALGKHPRRVLVCTDCLSEGINLQDHFDSVIHYDLSWNPTRHEQREGRVDRYGQPKPRVRTVTYYGADNPVDGIVLQVLLRKHKAIHSTLGITVPVPMDTNVVVEAIFESLLMREDTGSQMLLFDVLEPQRRELEIQWNAAVEREKKSRTIYAQRSIRVEDVAREVTEVRRALGDDGTVESFTIDALKAAGATVSKNGVYEVSLTGTPRSLREALGLEDEDAIKIAFRDPLPCDAIRVNRTHPVVAGVADFVWKLALDPLAKGPARRCGTVRTRRVEKRTTVLLLRVRFDLVTTGADRSERQLLAEDTMLTGFRGSPEEADWLSSEALEGLLDATPDANTPPEAARSQVQRILDRFQVLSPTIELAARRQAEHLLDAHRRVRQAARLGVRALRVAPHLPPDVLGVFVLLPLAGGGGA